MAFVGTVVEAALVSGGFEAMTSNNRVDEFFPKCTRFRVTLESMLDRKHKVERKRHTMTDFKPIGILIVDVDEGRNQSAY